MNPVEGWPRHPPPAGGGRGGGRGGGGDLGAAAGGAFSATRTIAAASASGSSKTHVTRTGDAGPQAATAANSSSSVSSAAPPLPPPAGASNAPVVAAAAAETAASPSLLQHVVAPGGRSTPSTPAGAAAESTGGSEPPATPAPTAGAGAGASVRRGDSLGGGAARSPARSGAASPANGKSGSKGGGSSSSSKASGGSKKAKSKVKSKHGTVVKGWQPIDDRMACNVCMDEQDYDMNPMMQCCKCKVRVHQHCYASREDKGASWMCDVCAAGEDASVTQCELCKETKLSKGGAMKQAIGIGENGEKLWVHVSCAMWIPEVRFNSEDLDPVNLDLIEKGRKTLRCLLCGQRGTCVQCAGGRCLLSYHPWCLIHSKRGIINRSISVQSHLHVFCQDHKADVISSLDLEGRECQLGPMSYQEARDRIQPKMQTGFFPLLIQAPANGGKGGSAKSGRLSGGKQAFTGNGNGNGKKRNRDGSSSSGGMTNMEGDGGGADQPHSPHLQQGRKRRRKFGPGPSAGAIDVAGKDEPEPECVEKPTALMAGKTDPDPDIDEDGNLILQTFWDKAGAPRIGQDSVTSERFWEVMGGYFPEGHKIGWLDKLLDIEHLPKDNDPAFVIPEPREKVKDKDKDNAAGDKDNSQQKASGSGGSSSPKGGGPDDGAESDDSNPGSVDDGIDAGALEDIDDEEYSANQRRRGGSGASGGAAYKGGKAPTARPVRGSGSVGGWSDTTPPPEPAVVDSELKAATCHRQLGLVLQRGKRLRAGCRFAIRVAHTPEDELAIEKERVERGVEWARFEMPADDELDLDFEAYPGLVTASKNVAGEAGGGGCGGTSSSKSGDGLLPAVAAAAPAAAVAGVGEAKEASPEDGNESGGDGDCDFSNLFVALQGWVRHDVDDPEVRLQPRGAITPAVAGAIATGAATGASDSVIEEGGDGASVAATSALASTDDSTNLAAAAVAAADATAEVAKLAAASDPLPVLDDEVVEALKLAQEKLRENTRECRSKIDPIRAIVDPMVEEAASFAIKNDQLYTRYCRVQMWKRMYNKLHYGVADRPLNFNKIEEADCESAIPASWRRDVDGRQSREEHEAEVRAAVEQANKEDAVCMVCFDGSTDESAGLTIVYCDGCEMPVHMECYGIQDAKADFVCDRCTRLRELEAESKMVTGDEVNCCLCPNLHGALKRTACGRFAHMTCLLTTPGVRIGDLKHKKRIDISEVHTDVSYLPDLLPYDPGVLEAQQAAARQMFLPAADTSPSAEAGAGSIVVASGNGTHTSAWPASAAGGSSVGAPVPAAGDGAGDRQAPQRNWLESIGQPVSTAELHQAQPFARNTNAVNTAVALMHQQQQQQLAVEDFSVDVSAPSGSEPIIDMAASAPPQPRLVPARDSECCFCGVADGTLLDCGITECGIGGGGCLRHGQGRPILGGCGAGVPGADGNLGDGKPVCGKRFHFLCAWFAGAYVKVDVTDPSFTRGERGLSGDMSVWPRAGEARYGFPTGFSVEARCLEHSVGAPGRKGAPPAAAAVRELAGADALPPGTISALGETEGAIVSGTTSEEQKGLRTKYLMKFQPPWQVEGKKRKKTKAQLKREQKKAEGEQPNNMSTMRVSGPRPLDPDPYERFSCAVCMKIAAPVLLGPAADSGAGAVGAAGGTGGAAAGGEVAGGGAAAAADEDLAQCAKCGVRVHRKCYGVPEGVGAPGAAKKDRWHCVPCVARVSQPTCTLCPRKGGAFFRIKANQYCHAYCAERTPGARVVDPVPLLPPPPPRAVDESLEDGGALVTLEAGAGEGGGNGSAGVDVLQVCGIVRAIMGGKGEGGKGKAAKKPAAGAAAAAAAAREEEEDEEDEEDEEGAEGSRDRRGRTGSGSSRKRPCSNKALGGRPLRAGGLGEAGSAAAAAAAAGGRVGNTGAAARALCLVKTAETKGVPKEIKKLNKCDICKRKYGAVVPCTPARSQQRDRACEKWVHPMCAAHAGRHWRTLSPEEAAQTPFKSKYSVTCQDHTALCLRQLSSGHWVDFLSLYKLRTDLDRARVLFDCVLRREKIKRQLHRTSSDLFDACLAHFRASTAAGAAVLAERLEAIAAASAAAAAAQAALEPAPEIDFTSGSDRTRLILSQQRDAREAAAASAAATAAVAAAAAAAARKSKSNSSGRKGGRAAATELAASVPWYGKYTPLEENALTLPENPDLTIRLKLPRSGSDLVASEFGRVRKKTLKAEEAGGMAGANARLAAAEEEAKRRKIGTGGPVERWPAVSTAPASQPRPLWPLGTERPVAGREGSHTRSVAAAQRLVDSCIGAAPLEGIAAAVLLQRRSASASGSHKVPGHFGTVLANLVGARNIRPLTEARRAYVNAHPRRELPPPPPQEQLLLDRQLMDMYTTISQKRVLREENDPKWESGKLKPDDGMRDLGELFEEAPSVESYPEYHAKVKKIMDLNTIRKKVVDREYSGMEGLLADVALMYSNAQAIKHEQATKDGKQLLILAQSIVERLQRERKEGTPRKDKLRQQSASDAERQPAAVFGDGLHISCAKCSRLRRDPPAAAAAAGGRSFIACTKKERYWFCESCVTESPDAFTWRGIGVYRRDGKWKMATVRGYEPLSGKHEVVYRGDHPWEFLSLGDPSNHIRYRQPVPPASLNGAPEMQRQERRPQQQEEKRVNSVDRVVSIADRESPPCSGAASILLSGRDKGDGGGDPPKEKEALLDGGSSAGAVVLRMEKANGGAGQGDGADAGDGGTSGGGIVGIGAGGADDSGSEDKHVSRVRQRTEPAELAGGKRAAAPATTTLLREGGEASTAAALKRKREDDVNADEERAEVAAKRAREENFEGGGSLSIVGSPLFPTPPVAAAAYAGGSAATCGGLMDTDGSGDKGLTSASADCAVEKAVRASEAPKQQPRPEAGTAGIPLDERRESGTGEGYVAAFLTAALVTTVGATAEEKKEQESIDGVANPVGGGYDNATAISSTEGGVTAEDRAGPAANTQAGRGGPFSAAGPPPPLTNGPCSEGAASTIPASSTIFADLLSDGGEAKVDGGAGAPGKRPRQATATPPPSLDGDIAELQKKRESKTDEGKTSEENKDEMLDGTKPVVLEDSEGRHRAEPLAKNSSPHQGVVDDSQKVSRDGGIGSAVGGRSSGELRIQAPAAASFGGSSSGGGRTRSRLLSNSGSSSNSSVSSGGSGSVNRDGCGAVGSRGTKRNREDDGWRGAAAASGSAADDRASKERRTKSPRR